MVLPYPPGVVAELETPDQDDAASYEDISTMEKVASSDAYELYANRSNGRFAVVISGTGSVWYSNPPASALDENAKNRVKGEMASQLIITYINKGDTTVSSVASFSANDSLRFTSGSDGFTIEYDFKELGFTIPVYYSVGDDGLTVSMQSDKIREEGSGRILSVSLVPFFGAADLKDEGYIFVPDGSGALIYLNNGKTGRNIRYSQRVYGKDKATVQESAGNTEQTVRLPVFGLKKGDTAYLAVIDEGDTLSSVDAYVSMLENSYNNVFATWHLRAVDQYTIGDSASAVVNLIYQEKINPNLSYKVKFFFLEGDEANYSGMASVYRSYLIGKHDLKPSYKPREEIGRAHV